MKEEQFQLSEDGDVKSIRIPLPYIDENGNQSKKVMTIKLNKVKIDNYRGAFMASSTTYSMSFSLKIIEHIHSGLLGKFIPSNDLSDNGRVTEYPEDFTKTLNAESINQITKSYCKIISDYKFILDLNKAEIQKVIFYKFYTSNRDAVKSSFDSTPLGVHTEMNYTFMVGYISKDGRFRYNKNKRLVKRGETPYDLSYVKWTEQRELFFQSIHSSFKSVIEKINEFRNNLTEEKINLIIDSKQKLLND